MRRDELSVQADGELNAVSEVLCRNMGDGDGSGGVLHALGVLLRAEDVDGLVVRRAVSLQALVTLLTVVESGRHSMDAKEG